MVFLRTLVLFVVGLIAVLFVQPARAAVPVTNTLDSGPGSLRQAVLNAAPGDTVIFSQDVFSVARIISVSSAPIEIANSLTIDAGDVAMPTINGSNINGTIGRGFDLGPYNSVTLNHLKFASTFAAIVNGGILTISNSVFENNYAAYRFGWLGGGAIRNYRTATIINSTFTGNVANAGSGGAILNDAVMYIVNSTFTGNHAVYNEIGNWDPGGYGAAIANYGALSVVNSTFSGNVADTIGSGIYNEGVVTLTNTIVANGTGINCSGSFVDGGYNLENTNTCGLSPTLNSLISTTVSLGSLQVNAPGLPIPTMALLFGSPAINAGDDAACPPTDERGVHRPIGLHCDIGAYEAPSMVWLLQVMRQ